MQTSMVPSPYSHGVGMYCYGVHDWQEYVGAQSLMYAREQVTAVHRLRAAVEVAAASHDAALAQQTSLLANHLRIAMSSGETLEEIAARIESLTGAALGGFNTLAEGLTRQEGHLARIVDAVHAIAFHLENPSTIAARELFQSGEQLARHGLYIEAIADFRSAAAMRPAHPILQLRLAELHYLANADGVPPEFDEAERHADLAVRYLVVVTSDDPEYRAITDEVLRGAAQLQFVRASNASRAGADEESRERLQRAQGYLNRIPAPSGDSRLLRACVALHLKLEEASLAELRSLADETRSWIPRALAEPNLAAMAEDVAAFAESLRDEPGPRSRVAYTVLAAADEIAPELDAIRPALVMPDSPVRLLHPSASKTAHSIAADLRADYEAGRRSSDDTANDVVNRMRGLTERIETDLTSRIFSEQANQSDTQRILQDAIVEKKAAIHGIRNSVPSEREIGPGKILVGLLLGLVVAMFFSQDFLLTALSVAVAKWVLDVLLTLHYNREARRRGTESTRQIRTIQQRAAAFEAETGGRLKASHIREGELTELLSKLSNAKANFRAAIAD